MMFKTLVSIVVPIYKVEQYLRECVDSILNQTYENLQVILVDDGSPDRCGEIIEAYKKVDSRIVTVHKENGGLSSARNEGMKFATGEYIAFIDSDDVLNKNYVMRLVGISQTFDSDIAACSFEPFENKIPDDNKQSDYKTLQLDSKQTIFEMYKNNSIGWSAWNKLYKRSLFEGIQYPFGVICEDKATTYKLYLKAHKISYTYEPLYYYRIRNNSISGEHSIKFCLDSMRINCEMEKDFEEKGLKDVALVAKSYSAKCAFLLYADAINRVGYDEVIRKCVQELASKYKYIRNAKYLSRIERMMIIISGLSAKTKTKIALNGCSKIANMVRKKKVSYIFKWMKGRQ